MNTPRPLLIYDGDCGFCRYCVRYAERLTGDVVEYQPFQQVATGFPQISREQFEHAIQFIAADGTQVSAAEAAFQTLGYVPSHRFWLWLYRHVPGFAAISEWSYHFVARRRDTFYRVCRGLFGAELRPAQYDIVISLFLRMLGIIYLSAFVSLGVQIVGLVGADGILPLGEYLHAVAQQLGLARWWKVPTIFWINASDVALQGVCVTGAVLGLLLALGIWQRVALIGMFVLYLSLLYAGQIFMSYQWDVLLLEVGFLAIFLPTRSHAIVWLFRWLLFRFMLLSGAVKLLSNDPTWATLTALTYHYQTQPLPTWLAWYAHHLPDWFHRLAGGGTFVVELVLPFFIFLPRRLRFVAAFGIIFFEGLIFLTGNYNFFNILTVALCVFMFDDAALTQGLPGWMSVSIFRATEDSAARTGWRPLLSVVVVVVLFAGGVQLWRTFSAKSISPVVMGVMRIIQPFHIVNSYGLFAVMTTTRNEIIVEGSADGRQWSSYEFIYKPGELEQQPRWATPHQPRLDWQMWFAALGTYRQNPWFVNFAAQLLQGSPGVSALLAYNPFPAIPPQVVRAKLYEYEFSDPETKRQTGQWWTRSYKGLYMPAISHPSEQ